MTQLQLLQQDECANDRQLCCSSSRPAITTAITPLPLNLTVSCCPQSLSSGTVSNAWAMAQTRCHHGAETFCSTVHEKDACRAQRLEVIVSFVQARQQTLSSRFVEASLSGGELSMVQRLQPPQGMLVLSCTCVDQHHLIEVQQPGSRSSCIQRHGNHW